MYHQLSECGTTLTKVLKPNQQYHLSSIIYKQLIFKKNKYLANSHLEKNICQYCILELETVVVNLDNDLFNNHLRDNPLCSWFNETEDGEHYFFHCNKYERHQFFEIARDFQPLTINILLYGYETLDYQLNTELFSAVHEYIKSTKRFANT